MWPLLLLSLATTAAAATPFFHCSSEGPLTVTSSLSDFRLTTRRDKLSSYSSDLSCEFNAESPNTAFFLEVESFNVSSAVLSISSGDQLLFRGSRLQKHQTSIVTPSRQLTVRFDAAGDRSNIRGVTVRVRALDVNGCPPGWTYLNSRCFGRSSTSGRLGFADAQRACNNMRANLLILPSYFTLDLDAVMEKLPSSLGTSLTWIGLTDLAALRLLYWLNGDHRSRFNDIGCVLGGTWAAGCAPQERCAAVIREAYYVAYMDDCRTPKSFICTSSRGGSSEFYPIPSELAAPTSSIAWIWGVVVGCLLVAGLITAGIVVAVRKNRARRQRAGVTGTLQAAEKAHPGYAS